MLHYQFLPLFCFILLAYIIPLVTYILSQKIGTDTGDRHCKITVIFNVCVWQTDMCGPFHDVIKNDYVLRTTTFWCTLSHKTYYHACWLLYEVTVFLQVHKYKFTLHDASNDLFVILLHYLSQAISLCFTDHPSDWIIVNKIA